MKRWQVAAGVSLLAAACALFAAMLWLKPKPAGEIEMGVREAVAAHAASPANNALGASDGNDAPSAPRANEEKTYESPVDFKALQKANPDIYAWLYIVGTDVNYPILQRAGEDSFYLKHSSEGEYSENGAVFTEETYTQKDFTDPVTVVYGHYVPDGTMFGSLQTLYSTPDGIEAHREIVVYLPERELHYEVFAAVPHDMRHILYYHDFNDPAVKEAFLAQALSVRSINASVDEKAVAGAADQLLILSTCLRGDSHQRYLVLAKRTAESAAP